eukprot:6077920-Pleurochrysis_carterae.AAC.1
MSCALEACTAIPTQTGLSNTLRRAGCSRTARRPSPGCRRSSPAWPSPLARPRSSRPPKRPKR